MTTYHFESEEFALSDDGIHLLRNRFNYQTINYDEIKSATVSREIEVKRPLLLLCLGLALLWFAVKQGIGVIGWFIEPPAHSIDIAWIVLPIIPGALGIYCLYTALRKGPILRFREEKKGHKLQLRSFFKQNQLLEFTSYLSTRLGDRLNVKL